MCRVTTVDCKEGEGGVSCVDRENVLHTVSPQARGNKMAPQVGLLRHLRRQSRD